MDGPKIGMTPLGIMFLAIRAACSMAVRAMRRGVWWAARPPSGVIPILGLGVDGIFYFMYFLHTNADYRNERVNRGMQACRMLG